MDLLGFLGECANGVGNALNNIGTAIGDGLQNIGKGIGNAILDVNNWGSNAVNDLGKLPLFDGNFEGISKEGIEELKSQIGKYCREIEEKISTFNADGQINNSIKGSAIEPAVRKYVKAIQELLAAYVSVMRQNIDYATKAYAAYESMQKNVAQNVESNAEQIRKNAQSIRLD